MSAGDVRVTSMEVEWLELTERLELLTGYPPPQLTTAPPELLEQILTQDVFRLFVLAADAKQELAEWRGKAQHYRLILGEVSDLIRHAVVLPVPGETGR